MAESDGQSAVTRADDDLSREELARRSDSDKQIKEDVLRLLLRADAGEENPASQRTQVMRGIADEIARRMAFDEKHPHIYKTAEERQQAYLALNPQMILEQYEQSSLKSSDPGQ